MRHTRIQQAKPERSFAERIVAVIVAIAMLGGMGYATTSAAMAADAKQTAEQQAGISLGLYDYDRYTINKNHALKFKNVGPETYNKYVGPGAGAYTGIVNKTLTKGYPTTTADKGSESLDYLFGGKPDDKAVTIHKPTGGLLTLDKDGYYGFDADSQYATYDEALNKFTWRYQRCTDQSSTPCFAPFGDGSEHDKYSFGMNLDAEFYMPEGGKVNNQPWCSTLPATMMCGCSSMVCWCLIWVVSIRRWMAASISPPARSPMARRRVMENNLPEQSTRH